MNLYKGLIAATVATLATVPSISGFTHPATFAVRSQQAAAFRFDSIGDFGAAAGVHQQHSSRGSVKPLSMASPTFSRDAESYPEGMSPEEELDYLRQAAEEIYAGQEDAPDIDELMKVIAISQSRAEPEASDMDTDFDIGIEEVRCDVAIAIDVIALVFEVAGLGGNGAKKVSRSVYGKLPRSRKKDLEKILTEMDNTNFAEKAFDIIKLIYESLTWNALKDSFNELGWWDALVFGVSFAAIFATGGLAFIIKCALFANSFVGLIINITECELL